MTKASKDITLHAVEHRGKQVLMMQFPYSKGLQEIAQENLKARYSRTYRGWWMEHTSNNLQKIFRAYKGKAWVDATALYGGKAPVDKRGKPRSAKVTMATKQEVKIPPEFEQTLIRRNYAANTRKTYVSLFRGFVAYFHPKKPEEVTTEEIKKYLLHVVDTQDLSYSTQTQIINAIKFYYEKVLGLKKETYWIDRPRKEKKLPQVLSAEEVGRMLDGEKNLKHWCIIAVIYSAGLRRGEVVKLRRKDVDMDRRQIFVRDGKGKKDRVTVLSDWFKEKLEEYLEEENPRYWLFEGPRQRQYSGSSVGSVVRDAAKAAGIIKNVTPHILRHSFATHMMDGGTDTRVIQEVLGHKSILTTMGYTHVSQKDFRKLRSPLDDLFDSK